MSKESGLDVKNWTPVKDTADVLKGIDAVHCFYDAYGEAEANKLYDGLDLGKQKQAAVKTAKKVPKVAKTTTEDIQPKE